MAPAGLFPFGVLRGGRLALGSRTFSDIKYGMANLPEDPSHFIAAIRCAAGGWLRVLALFCAVLLAGCAPTIISAPDWSSDGSRDRGLGMRVAQTAKSQIGVRYRLGGTTPRGFDCSGLIWWAYRQHGINVPRVTEDQARAGYGVGRGAMRAGDILVFRTRQGRTGLHTALYTGGGNFVHSPSSGKRIREDNLRQEYWNRKLIMIRRVVR